MALAAVPAETSERKVLTVLFADLRDSLSLIAGRDPESADEILGRGVEIMTDAVLRHSGTVVRTMGDGIMAVFGAPHSIEHHAAQACTAALEIRRNILASPKSRLGQSDIMLSVRVGLHSGEVVFKERLAGGIFSAEVSGEVVHVAARMEQIAHINAILITHETMKDISAFFQTRVLGERNIKGLNQPRPVFELLDENATSNRFSGMGRLPFLGRDEQVRQLRQARVELQTGQGSLVKLVGDAGVGKSRLINEALGPALPGQNNAFGQCLPFKRRGYQLICSLLMSCLGIVESQPWSIDTALLRERLSLLDCNQATEAVAMMIGSVGSETIWTDYTPAERRAEIHAQTIRVIAAAVARRKTLICILEDLQWLDHESEELLKALVASQQAQPVLYILSTRLEQSLAWLPRDHLLEINLAPLPSDALGSALADRLQGEGADELVTVLTRRAAGNPLFMETMISSLIGDGTVATIGGKLNLLKKIGLVSLPATIRELLTIRVDRLPVLDKQLLQAAAVIGLESPEDLLVRVAQLGSEFDPAMARLRAMDFLRVRMAGHPTYCFCHELMREAVYASMLLKKRRDTHLVVVEAIRDSVAGNELSAIEDLAEHSRFAESWVDAVHYAHRAAKKLIARDANTEAVYFINAAFESLDRWEDDDDSRKLRLDLHLAIRDPLFRLGHVEAIFEHLDSARQLITGSRDWRQQGLYHILKSHFHTLRGASADALEECAQAMALAGQHHDPALAARAQFQEGLEHFQRWEFSAAVQSLSNALEYISRNLDDLSYGLQRGFDITALSYIVRSEAELGRFAEAQARIPPLLEIAERRGRAFESFFSCLALGHLHEMMDQPATATAWLEKAENWCHVGRMPLLSTIAASHLGLVLVRQGRVEAGLTALQSVHSKIEIMKFHGQLPFCLTSLAEAYIATGDWAAAQNAAERALGLAKTQNDRGAEGMALLLISQCVHRNLGKGFGPARELMIRALDLAHSLSLQPLVLRCQKQADRMGIELLQRQI